MRLSSYTLFVSGRHWTLVITLVLWAHLGAIASAPPPQQGWARTELRAYGFVELESVANTRPDQSANAVRKTELRSRLELRWGRPDLHLFAGMDAYFEPDLFNTDPPYWHRYSEESGIARNLRIYNPRRELAFNELYAGYTAHPLRMRLGNQLYHWGTGEVYNPTNYFNPYDFREFLFRDSGQLKQGVPSLSAIRVSGRYTTELVAAFVHLPMLLAPAGAPWSIEMEDDPYETRILPGRSLPTKPENFGLGGRISTTLPRADLSVSAYHGPDREPVFVPSNASLNPDGTVTIIVKQEYHPVRGVGFDLSKSLGDFVFQLEAAFSPNKRGLLKQDLDGPPLAIRIPFETRRSRYISYTAGFTSFMRAPQVFKNHDAETVFTLDWFQSRYLDDDLHDPFFTDLLTVRIQDSFFNGRVMASFTAMFETKHRGTLFRPQAQYVFRNGLSIDLSYVTIECRDGDGIAAPLFHHFRKNDFAAVAIRYRFN